MLPGTTCANEKNAEAAVQNATDGAATLNRIRRTERVDLLSQNEMTRASRTTVSVPADGPNISADANTNVSETENRAESDGTLTVKEPVKSVNTARVNHSNSGGDCIVVANDFAMIARPAAITTP